MAPPILRFSLSLCGRSNELPGVVLSRFAPVDTEFKSSWTSDGRGRRPVAPVSGEVYSWQVRAENRCQ